MIIRIRVGEEENKISLKEDKKEELDKERLIEAI